MLFSDESYKTAEACRFCWMCRHVCPAVGVTGNETWTPHARGLLVSMEKRGMPFEESMAKAMYMCCLCDACATNCETGWKPSIYIREARTAAVAQGIARGSSDGVFSPCEAVTREQAAVMLCRRFRESVVFIEIDVFKRYAVKNL